MILISIYIENPLKLSNESIKADTLAGFKRDMNLVIGPKFEVRAKSSPVAPKWCKICLGEDSNKPGNPMFNPCECLTGLNLVHYKCMYNWVRSKCKVTNTMHSMSYYWEIPNWK